MAKLLAGIVSGKNVEALSQFAECLARLGLMTLILLFLAFLVLRSTISASSNLSRSDTPAPAEAEGDPNKGPGCGVSLMGFVRKARGQLEQITGVVAVSIPMHETD